ncbi:MAG TPA: hypothetical protein DCG47_02960 [Spirochaetaceae bacterium]|jgi:Na+/H+-dicarboxylate symporter|nr:hypothetical protein [Spirochaetaceae bacterium]
MKIWLKYLIATILGIALGLVVPAGGALLDTIAGLFMNAARAILIPLLFFSIIIATQELREDRRLLRVLSRSVVYSLAGLFLMSLVGIVGAFALSPERIPLNADSAALNAGLPKLSELFKAIFPANALSVFLNSDYLLPLLIVSIIAGVGLCFDRSITKSLSTLIDAASRVLWQINSFIVELLPLPIIVLAAARVVSLRGIPRLQLYGNLILIVVAELAFVTLILLPLILFLHERKSNPFKTLYGLIGPAFLALVAGHALVPAGALLKHLKESLGVRRRAGALSLTVALSMGRAGSAMVSATAFIVVLSSYSSLGLGSGTIAWMLAFVPLSALLLSAVPASGPLAALLFLSASYGRGFESGYLLMVPAALPLMALSSFLDTLFAGCVTRLAAGQEGYAGEKAARHFI